jgi:DNA-binding CsgD family transcriptional regulator
MYLVRREAGRLEWVRPLITGEESPAERWAPGLLALYTELGMEQSARRLLWWLLDRYDDHDRDSGDWPIRLVFMVEAATGLEDLPAARRLRPLMADYAGLNLLAGHFAAVFGSADRYLGRLDSLLGAGSPADRFEAALDLDRRTEAPLHQAETLAAHAAHLRQTTKNPARAQQLTEQALSIAEPRGLRRITGLLASGGRQQGRALARPDGLTSREIDVLRLLGAGASNREIAGQLFITENTAANHVRNILMKIGAGNRTQAALYAATHGLL